MPISSRYLNCNPQKSSSAESLLSARKARKLTVRDQVINFYANFRKTNFFDSSYQLHNPFDAPSRRAAIEEFCAKFYDDDKPRVHLIGINPSRLVTSSTGVNYTDGFALKEFCGIDNSFSKSRELTATFFYEMINQVGGSETFYSRVFAWAALPVAITDGNSYTNYYDVPEESVRELVLNNLRWMMSLPNLGRLVIVGTGENKKFLESLPGYPFGYNEIVSLPHPRWIMQYNRKNIAKYVDEYCKALQ